MEPGAFSWEDSAYVDVLLVYHCTVFPGHVQVQGYAAVNAPLLAYAYGTKPDVPCMNTAGKLE